MKLRVPPKGGSWARVFIVVEDMTEGVDNREMGLEVVNKEAVLEIDGLYEGEYSLSIVATNETGYREPCIGDLYENLTIEVKQGFVSVQGVRRKWNSSLFLVKKATVGCGSGSDEE